MMFHTDTVFIMNSPTTDKMGFDDWLELAMNDPDAFEDARSEAIQAMLSMTSERSQARLARLQWRIDMIRDRSKNPMVACQTIYNLMWDKLAGEQGMLDALKNLANDRKQLKKPAKTADILDFRARLPENGEPA